MKNKQGLTELFLWAFLVIGAALWVYESVSIARKMPPDRYVTNPAVDWPALHKLQWTHDGVEDYMKKESEHFGKMTTEQWNEWKHQHAGVGPEE